VRAAHPLYLPTFDSTHDRRGCTVADGVLKVRHVIEERIDSAMKTIQTMSFKAYHNGSK
jgi:hypothetical protein